MLYDMLSKRAIQVGLAFFLIVVGGSLLYSWHTHHTTAVEFAETQQMQHYTENQNTTRLAAVGIVSPGDRIPPPENTEARQRLPEETDAETIDEIENLDGIETALFDELFADVESLPDEVNEEGPVSPFGFGPYPEIPDDFPEPDIFESLASMGTSDMRKALELQKRLIVEFWKRGRSLENVGVTGDADGKVYLLYPNVVYVTWDYWTDENGATHRYAGVTRGHPDTAHIYEPYLDEGEIPPGITVYELPDGYIDAYEFLGLTR